MKIIGNEDSQMRVTFDSFGEFLKYVKETPRHDGAGDSSTRITAKDKWDLSCGWDGAFELANRGWSKGLDKMSKARSLVNIPEHSDQSMQMKPFNEVSGDEVDVGMYLTGEPECMIDYQLRLTPSYGKVAKVIVNCSASCNVNSGIMFRRGAAACILIDALESAGVRCEVWTMPMVTESRKTQFTSEVLVKKADQHLEPDRLAFMLAHPAVLRRLGFALLEKFGGAMASMSMAAYGHCLELPKDEQNEDGTIYFKDQCSGYSTDKEMILTVNELLAKYVETDMAVA